MPNNWLSLVFRKLQSPVRIRKSVCAGRGSAVVERLERRQLLSATAVAVGSETLVNSFTTGQQSSPVVAMDSAGDYVVAWASAGQDRSGFGIFAQRYNAAGVAQGSEFQVNTYTAGDQSSPSIAMDSTGDFVIVWVSSGQDGSGAGVYGQRYNAAGVAQGGEFRANTYTTSDQKTPSVAMDATGDFVVAWDSQGQYHNFYTAFIGSYSIYAQRYNAAGTAQGTEFRVNTSTTSVQFTPTVSMDATGDFIVAWSSKGFDTFSDPWAHIAAKRYDSTGAVIQDEFNLSGGGGAHGQFDPQVAMDPNGQYVVAWHGSYDDGFDEGVIAYSSAVGGAFAVNTDIDWAQTNPRVAIAANGNFVIAWQSDREDGSGFGIYSQQYDAVGNKLGSETRVNTYTTGDQASASVAMDAVGNFVVAWASGQDGSSTGVYSQLFSVAQTPLLLQIEGTTLSAVASLFTPVTSTLNVADAVNANWTGATVAITGNYQNGQDVLSFTNTPKISGSFNASTGALTLTGTATITEYRDALRSVTYHNSSATPNTALTRTITFQVQAGATLSNTITRQVQVKSTSNPPILTGINPNTTFVDPSPPMSIAPNLVVTDPDGLNIQSATVTFTNWQGEDRLAFYNSLALQHTFTQDLNAHTATLTITGSATAAGYQTLLRSVTYQDVSAQPNTTTRVVTMTVSDQLHSGSATTNIAVARYLSGLSNINFVQGSSPVAIAPNLVITPPAGVSNIQSATVMFTNWQGEDRLAFYNSLALQHSFTQDLNAHTATLTISGNASPAGYQTLLRSVTYQDVAGEPITSTRVATITLNDGTNAPYASENVAVTAANQPPLVQVNDSSSLSYKVNAAPIAIMSQALVSDPDSNNLTSLTVQISSGFQVGHDVLSFANQLGITGSYNASTGLLTLTGSSYVGNYRTALRAVMFNTTGSGVSTATRTFKVIATDSTNVQSAAVTRNMTVVP